VRFLFRLEHNWDESLDAWAIHSVGGVWGTIAIGIFAVPAIGGISGLIVGGTSQIVLQIVGVLAAVSFAFFGTLILAKGVDLVFGLRVTKDEEYVGLDISQHGETLN